MCSSRIHFAPVLPASPSPFGIPVASVRMLPSYVRWSEVVHLSGVYCLPTDPDAARLQDLEQARRVVTSRGVATVAPVQTCCRQEAVLSGHARPSCLGRSFFTSHPLRRRTIVGVLARCMLRCYPTASIFRRCRRRARVAMARCACSTSADSIRSRGSRTFWPRAGFCWTTLRCNGRCESLVRVIRICPARASGDIATLNLVGRVVMIGAATGDVKERLFEDSDLVVSALAPRELWIGRRRSAGTWPSCGRQHRGALEICRVGALWPGREQCSRGVGGRDRANSGMALV